MTRGRPTAAQREAEETRSINWLREQVHKARRGMREVTVPGARQRMFVYVSQEGRELKLRIQKNGKVRSLAAGQETWTIVTPRVAEIIQATVRYMDTAADSGGREADDQLRGVRS